MSGANSTPLGRMNPAIGSGKRSLGMSLLNPSYIGSSSANPSANVPGSPQKRDAEGNDDGASAERKRRRKSRWQSTEKEKTYIPGMPTVLPPNMDKEQEEAYLLQLQIEEMSRRLRFNDLGISSNPEDRSPSPEPIYNNEGKRLNTREYRTRKKLEEDRHHLIQKMMKLNTEYKPPSDYKPPLIRVCDKVFIPQDEHPEINFVGLLIGPRGNTLKSMEKETGAKIIIRGKGSVKEGKVGRKDGQPLPGEDEPLHAYITGTNPEFVKKAVDKIKGIIKQGVDVPESQNDLRRMQLRELALLNGTLRETDGPKCSNCGATTHKSWQCQDKPNITNSVVCSSCGGAGHIAKDCRQRQMGGPMMGGGMGVDRQKIDEEYMSLMAELGEGPPPQSKGPHGNDGNRMNNSSGMRGLFDPPSGPPRALMPSPHGSQGPHPMNGMGPNMRNTGPNNGNWGNMQGGFGGNRGPPGQNMNGSGSGDHRNQGPSFGVRPPMNWQQQQQSHGGNQQQGLMGGPPPPPPPGQNSGGFQPRGGSSLLSAPPPPPPPNNSSSGGPNQQPWMNSGGGPPNQRHQGNSWQGGMGGPPGPVPPPRPVGPPQNWGWNSPQSGGPRPPSGVDLGALLSAPPPPPPS